MKTSRCPEFEKLVNNLTMQLFGRERTSTQCVTCGTFSVDFDDFRDERSRIEFELSYMCQRCQDEVFGRAPADA